VEATDAENLASVGQPRLRAGREPPSVHAWWRIANVDLTVRIQLPGVVEHPGVLYLNSVHPLHGAIIHPVGDLGHGFAPPASQSFGLSIPPAALDPSPRRDLNGHRLADSQHCIGPGRRTADDLDEVAVRKNFPKNLTWTIALKLEF